MTLPMQSKLMRGAAGLALILLGACALQRNSLDPLELEAGLSSEDATVRAESAERAWQAGALGLPVVAHALEDKDPNRRKSAERALASIVHDASQPRRSRAREDANMQLMSLIHRSDPTRAHEERGLQLSPPTRNKLLHALAVTGEDGVELEALREALRDPQAFDAALFALERNSTEKAEGVLIEALRFHRDPDERVAFANALAARSSTAAVPHLLEAAQEGPNKVTMACHAALVRIGDLRASEWLVARVNTQQAGAGISPHQGWAELLHYAERLNANGHTAEARALYQQLGSDKPDFIRAGALAGIAQLPTALPVDIYLSALSDSSEAVRAVAREQLIAWDGRKDWSQLFASFADRPQGQAELLRVIDARREPEAADLVRASCTVDSPELRQAALELAGGYDSQAFEPVLRNGIATASSPEEAAVAARSLANHASLRAANGEQDKAVELYSELIELEDHPQIMRAGIDGVGQYGGLDSIAKVEPYAQTQGFKFAVDQARMSIATRAADHHPQEAVRILEAVCLNTSFRNVRTAAANRLRGMGVDTSQYARRSGFLIDWQLAGAFPASTASEFPRNPSSATNAETAWEAVRCESIDGILNLLPHFENTQNVECYAAAEFEWPRDEAITLKLGSDDGIAAWVNGELVHENRATRGLTLDSDVVNTSLRQGKNRIVLLITQGGGDWSLSARICDASGQSVDLTQL